MATPSRSTGAREPRSSKKGSGASHKERPGRIPAPSCLSPPGGSSLPERRSLHPLSTLDQRSDAFTGEAAHSLGGPEWLRRARAAAFERLAGSSLPTGEEEIWRYGRVGDLDLARFRPQDAVAVGGLPHLPQAAHALLDRVGPRAGFVLERDGALVAADLGEEAERAGVRLAPIGAISDGETLFCSARAGFEGSDETDALDDLATAFASEPLVLDVPSRLELAQPFVIVHLAALDHDDEVSGPAGFPYTVVRLGEHARASVVELYVSGTGAVLLGPVSELLIGDGAALSYSVVQELGRHTWQLGRNFAVAGRDATYSSFTASLGGEYARTRAGCLLTGEGGRAELLAAYLGDGTQVHDFRTLQEHRAPRTTSDLFFKGAVGDVARSVYSGTIRMCHGARGANAFQTNRNLVLSEGAHAHSVPNLDILENDVRCSHASAVGPIDSEQLFYLRSRGVPAAAAERLILLGFFNELVARAEPAIADHVVAAVKRRVGRLAEEARS